ncbi:MAG: metallophosphoesterase family protein [Chloroflexi bacterium]|nr:metallophosphoesterase family protein [Chloroflexota bacterium]MBK6711893.1 metallophosphoesterase family protein [Chloroflexota bacterium]MBK7178043.1 metallophosphoesterase family protein [Chloroflexota bacterium]MBK7919483.1 metallophosphoesterase family protein [Chloroflexota bacterium]MBK8931715.1 metallophosphoesterase family protein [Chloroflexota bacterium]
MKIMAVSDRVLDQLYHSHVRQYVPPCDLIIGCGDLPYYYLDFLISALDLPLLYVRGNHDQGPQYTADGRVLYDVPGGMDIHGQTVMHNGLILAGLEGSMRYRPQASLMYTEREMRWQFSQLAPRLLMNRSRYGRYLDVMVVHSPPFGIHDRPDLPHTGFKVFLTLMRLFKPRYLLHGHIHIYRPDTPRETQFGDTTVINVYPYRILDIS